MNSRKVRSYEPFQRKRDVRMYVQMNIWKYMQGISYSSSHNAWPKTFHDRYFSIKIAKLYKTGPNTGCFSRRWPLLGVTKLASKNLKNDFFRDKLYSLKVHAHYFTVLIYLAVWRAAKLGIFTHFNSPRCSQSIDSQIYVYSIQIPSCFLWMLFKNAWEKPRFIIN